MKKLNTLLDSNNTKIVWDILEGYNAYIRSKSIHRSVKENYFEATLAKLSDLQRIIFLKHFFNIKMPAELNLDLLTFKQNLYLTTNNFLENFYA
ncbi:hypothetical protein EI74_0174 [Mycoplasma testudineum]|uniref:Uncharacterized protein n=1 Tax=Mycoplasma testudineum TaxID=244584 RepID=A0A4R6IG75_9MOLU|nr:hypothetical protein [Mycoplasma testudineum]OYD27095.1 hypothetical protein CG473_00415 [Mycoplasma testudineum]TDO21152.1 hypothetical protein EI74_0174 [Mycoplasma testudineum]